VSSDAATKAPSVPPARRRLGVVCLAASGRLGVLFSRYGVSVSRVVSQWLGLIVSP
jgi:hypothetical protein